MSWIALAIVGAGGLAAGGGIAGGLIAASGEKGGKAQYNPYSLTLLNQIMAEYWDVKRKYKDVLNAKPWVVDQGEVMRAQKIMPQLDEAVAKNDYGSAQRLINSMPYFEQMYKDRIIYKHPQISRMLQKIGLTWSTGLRTPAEERLWEDITGSSRRMLGQQKTEAEMEADRLAALAGRPGTAGGEHAAIIDKYLRSYGEQEKAIRTQNTQEQLQRMEKGVAISSAEREYGQAAVEQAWQRKLAAQQLVNQLLSAASGTSSGAYQGMQTPPNKMAYLGQGISDASQILAGALEAGVGYSAYKDYMSKQPGPGLTLGQAADYYGMTGGSNPFALGENQFTLGAANTANAWGINPFKGY